MCIDTKREQSHAQKVQYAVVQHLFDGGNDVPVIIPPHGNAKKEKASYRCTQKSTLSKIKQIPGKPKNFVSVYTMKLVEAWVLPVRVNSLVIIAKYATVNTQGLNLEKRSTVRVSSTV